jgi:prepilin-type N-terminal cleavage/methylation domain-containing protein
VTRRAARGFTLPELLATLAAMGAFGAAVTAVGQRMSQESKADAGRVTDLAALRRAARLLEDDVRAGRDPVAEGWFRIGDQLRRRDVVVARSVAAFDVRQEGGLWHVSITLAPRTSEGPRREARLDFTVRARAPEDVR